MVPGAKTNGGGVTVMKNSMSALTEVSDVGLFQQKTRPEAGKWPGPTGEWRQLPSEI